MAGPLSTVQRLGGLLGLLLSFYALYVESEIAQHKRKAENKGGLEVEYKAACDTEFAFFGKSSCSAVLGSNYSHMLSMYGLVPKDSIWDVSNAAMGAVFYAGVIVHDFLPLPFPRETTLLLSLGSLGYSGFLFYIIKYVIKDFCIVCGGMYIANIVIFIGTLGRFIYQKKREQAQEKQVKDR